MDCDGFNRDSVYIKEAKKMKKLVVLGLGLGVLMFCFCGNGLYDKSNRGCLNGDR